MSEEGKDVFKVLLILATALAILVLLTPIICEGVSRWDCIVYGWFHNGVC